MLIRGLDIGVHLRPSHAWQLAGGAEVQLQERSFLDIEVYYRKLNRVLKLSPLVERQRQIRGLLGYISPIPRSFIEGRGETYGIEFFLDHSQGRVSSLLSYTLSWAYQKYADLNRGQRFPAIHDRRHDLSASFIYQLDSKRRLSAIWTYKTGAPFNLPVGFFILENPADFPSTEVTGDTAPEWLQHNARNSYRLPSYHRLDIAYRQQTKISGLYQRRRGSCLLRCL